MGKVEYDFSEYEMSVLIRNFRHERNISQEILYEGLCGKKTYYQMESGDSVMNQLLFERLLSRLHIQHRLFDIMLTDEEFDRLECRYEINLYIQKKQWEQAEQLLKEYEAQASEEKLHKQYVLMNRAEILFQTGEKTGRLFKEALELTMSVSELEKRLHSNGVIAEDELFMYFRYRGCEKEFSGEEYRQFLEVLEREFLKRQIYTSVYFEVAYQYVLKLWDEQEYVQCRRICKTAVAWLADGRKHFNLPELLFLDAIAGMRLRHDEEQERELLLQCKQAYYISSSFCKLEMAQKILEYCKEEFSWHITELGK